MDRLKGAANKRGIHRPSNMNLPIHRESWKSDIKGAASGKKKDPNEYARSHESAPLTTLRDPDSFGAPPRHTSVHGSDPTTPSSPARPQPSGGLGSVVPGPSMRPQQQQQEEVPKQPSGPYRADTTGLSTASLPKPPVRRADAQAQAPPPPPRSSSAASPPPALPSRQPQQRTPAPFLPPRMNENPDEFTPPPPPTYTEATQPCQRDPAHLNTDAISRLSQAGVSVPGFGIGGNNNAASQSPTITGHTGQLSELRQRFARMNTGSQSPQPTSPISSGPTTAAAAAQKRPPPPPPPKRAGLGGSNDSRPSASSTGLAPPPLPLSSKPRAPP